MVIEKFMRLAIEKAKEGIKKSQEPFGACVVRNGEVVSCTHNTVRENIDVTAHAEMNAIREACRKMNTTDLSGCEIYATFKPCLMCQSACERANIITIYYGAGPEDTNRQPIKAHLEITSGILREECLQLLE